MFKVQTYSKTFDWVKLISITGGAQIVIQILGLVSGILIIRILPTKEYALYTLSNTMLGTMTLLADGGISTGVMAVAARDWNNKDQLGAIINTGLGLRKKFAVYSLIITLPALFFLLRQHGSDLLFSFLIILCIIPAFYAALSDNLLEISLKLHQDIGRLQRNQIATGIGRFMMISVLFLFPWTFVAVLGNGIPRIWANFKLKKYSGKYANPLKNSDAVVKKEILSIVKNVMPGTIYYCISGQITIFLISIFGSTHSIAQAGALSRISMFLTVVTVVINTLIVPRFAKILDNPRLILNRFIQIQIILLIISATIVGLVWIFPSQILWVLGENYSNLKLEILLNIMASCISLIAGVCFSLNISRGWIINPAVYISLNLLFIIMGVAFFDVSTLRGVFIFNIFIGLLDVIIYIIYTFYKIRLL